MKKGLMFILVIVSLIFIYFFSEKSENKDSVNDSQIEIEQMTSAQQFEHITFKGIPIDGTIKDFVAKLTNMGFEYLGEEDGIVKLRGEFAGCKGCKIVVYSLESTKKVNAVGVIFPMQENWSRLQKEYDTLKTMLTEKYGKPSKCVDEFKNLSADYMKEMALIDGECTWITQYSTKNGNIELSIEKPRNVVLRYFDKINTNAVRSHAMDDL